jgi:hypothetical protein
MVLGIPHFQTKPNNIQDKQERTCSYCANPLQVLPSILVLTEVCNLWQALPNILA